MAHELEHIKQVEKDGWFCFYMAYLLYYLAGLFRYKSHHGAGHMIPYEIEARKVEGSRMVTDADRANAGRLLK
jgi:hypothetical protein